MSASMSVMRMTGSVKAMISAVRKLQGLSAMPPKKAEKRFFYITDLFRLTAKDWAHLLNGLDMLTLEERNRVLHGRDYE